MILKYKKKQKTMTTLNIFNKISIQYILSKLDYLFFGAFILCFILDLVSFYSLVLDQMSIFYYSSLDNILQMSNNGYGFPGNTEFHLNSDSLNNTGGNPQGSPGGKPSGFEGFNTNYTTNRQIIHDDGSWSNAIRSLFVYGTGSARIWYSLSRGGSPLQRSFIIGSTIAANGFSRLLQNSINDPSFVIQHAVNWRAMWNSNQTDSVNVYLDLSADASGRGSATSQRFIENPSNASETAQIPQSVSGTGLSSGIVNSSGGNTSGSGETANSVIGVDIDFHQIAETILNKISAYLDYFFEPVLVNFSNELLAIQIQNLSLILFFITVCIGIIFISFLFNLTAYIFSDRLLKYFKNKYIIWYISFNKKVIVFEIIMLSGWIIYLLYVLLYGLHYIATHPIIF